jgi:hypothetical protein
MEAIGVKKDIVVWEGLEDQEKEEPPSATTPTSAIVPTTMRALTELFLVAENLAMVCGGRMEG